MSTSAAPLKLAVVAGEASGDLHASEVIRELKKLTAVETFGIGGDYLQREGMTLLHHAREMGIVGLFNVLRHLPMFRRVFNELIERIEREKPDVVFLVDYPDFNLRVAKRCKELGLRVVYYISPQLWAWRKGRVRHIARYVDRMVVIFPFEETFYRSHDVPVTYVGHPLVEQLAHITKPPRDPQVLRIALLPGSRRMEVNSLLPAMLDAIEILRREGIDGRRVEASIIQAPTIHREQLQRIVDEKGIDVPIVPNDHGEAVAAADISLSSSGTATLESAVLGTPVVVMYRLSRATYMLAKKLVSLPHFSLVNIVAGRDVVPELIQHDVNGPRIASEVRKLVAPGYYEQVCAALADVRAKLGEPGAAARVAEEVHKMVRG
ncbi:MAG TPA: lipid-A-disaccharide synthase [Thermoanaerobaculia bacterium]|jgi:lipid-A-disaccharide synthase|nr:lipid-A-disaccharide synthase [Thermoanaerobaculia bacterium]